MYNGDPVTLYLHTNFINAKHIFIEKRCSKMSNVFLLHFFLEVFIYLAHGFYSVIVILLTTAYLL